MNILNLFRNYTIEQITGVETNISTEMYRAISLWNDMMAGVAPWNDKVPSCGVLAQIAGRLDTLVSREIGIEVDNEAIKSVMEHLNKNVDAVVDYITLLGSCLLRPVYSNGKLQYELLPLGNYLPVSYDFDGTLTEALLLKQIDDGNKKFLLAERHRYTAGTHLVECELYRYNGGVLSKASLAECRQTAELTPAYEWHGVKQPMIIEFRNHSVNKIDGSKVPVAIIAGAEDLIRDADEQYARMKWEQEAGELIVFADRDMFQRRQRRDGSVTKSELTPKLNKLIVKVEGDGSTDGKKIVEHSPALRTTQQNEMLQQIFRRIELTCNIGKGTISDMESQIQTATQYTGGRQELYAIVDKIEAEIEAKYHACASVFAHMAAAYRLGSGNSDIRIIWNDDTTRKDMTAAKQMALQEVSQGVKNKWEYRKDFFGEDEEQARANVPEEPVAASPFNF